MKIFELEQDKAIKIFLRKNDSSKEALLGFFQDHFLHPDLEVEFTNKVAKNIINITHQYYLSLSKAKTFHFLRALGKLFDIAFSIKMWEYQLSRDDASWFWAGIPTYFMSLDRLTEPIETMRHEINLVSKSHVYRKILLVEGESEYNFFNTMQELTSSASLDFPLYNYKGKGNIQNLVHYIKEKNRQGIKVLLTYDKDGQTESFLKKLKKHKCKLEDTFGFTKDFESSFPPRFLKFALDNYSRRYCNTKIRIKVGDIQKLIKTSTPFVVSFKDQFGISISKTRLAIILGKVMVGVIKRYWNEIFNKNDKEFRAEIYKFLKFAMRIR